MRRSPRKKFYVKDQVCWASHGHEDPNIARLNCELPTGRTVSFFLNLENGLMVADVISETGETGNEILRMKAKDVSLPGGIWPGT